MKPVMVEICDEQVAEWLRQAIHCCLDGSLPTQNPIPPFQMSTLISALRTCEAMNEILKYLGSHQVDLTSVELHSRIGD
jgi:hypothetical protein